MATGFDDAASAFEAALAQQQAPFLHGLLPGLSEDRVHELTAPLGLAVSRDVLRWWQWQGGVEHGRYMSNPLSDWFMWTLPDAIEWYSTQRAVALRDGIDDHWRNGWLPLARSVGQPVIAVDCDAPSGAASPVYVVAWGEDEESDQPKASSITEMLDIWTGFLRDGSWRWNRDTSSWDTDDRHLDWSSGSAYLF